MCSFLPQTFEHGKDLSNSLNYGYTGIRHNISYADTYDRIKRTDEIQHISCIQNLSPPLPQSSRRRPSRKRTLQPIHIPTRRHNPIAPNTNHKRRRHRTQTIHAHPAPRLHIKNLRLAVVRVEAGFVPVLEEGVEPGAEDEDGGGGGNVHGPGHAGGEGGGVVVGAEGGEGGWGCWRGLEVWLVGKGNEKDISYKPRLVGMLRGVTHGFGLDETHVVIACSYEVVLVENVVFRFSQYQTRY